MLNTHKQEGKKQKQTRRPQQPQSERPLQGYLSQPPSASSVVRRFPPLGGIPKAAPSHVQEKKKKTGRKALQQISVCIYVSGEIAKRRSKTLSFQLIFLKQKLPRDTGL